MELDVNQLASTLNDMSEDFKEFDIDMDAPPRERFKESSAYFRKEIVILFNEFLEEIPETMV